MFHVLEPFWCPQSAPKRPPKSLQSRPPRDQPRQGFDRPSKASKRPSKRPLDSLSLSLSLSLSFSLNALHRKRRAGIRGILSDFTERVPPPLVRFIRATRILNQGKIDRGIRANFEGRIIGNQRRSFETLADHWQTLEIAERYTLLCASTHL